MAAGTTAIAVNYNNTNSSKDLDILIEHVRLTQYDLVKTFDLKSALGFIMPFSGYIIIVHGLEELGFSSLQKAEA